MTYEADLFQKLLLSILITSGLATQWSSELSSAWTIYKPTRTDKPNSITIPIWHDLKETLHILLMKIFLFEIGIIVSLRERAIILKRNFQRNLFYIADMRVYIEQLFMVF